VFNTWSGLTQSVTHTDIIIIMEGWMEGWMDGGWGGWGHHSPPSFQPCSAAAALRFFFGGGSTPALSSLTFSWILRPMEEGQTSESQTDAATRLVRRVRRGGRSPPQITTDEHSPPLAEWMWCMTSYMRLPEPRSSSALTLSSSGSSDSHSL
jgi:hypothetical protein